MTSRILSLLLALALASAALAAGRQPAEERIQLNDLLPGRPGEKATVVVFLGLGCPVANVYLPRLNEFADRYQARGVRFFGVNSNDQDTAEAVGLQASEFGVRFTVAKDKRNWIADALRAERTPEAVLLDGEGRVRYRGRIDDQYGVDFRRPRTTRADLVEAIEELLAGKPVTVARTEVAGCVIGRADDARAKEITYANQVSRILQRRCQSCHRPEGVAPFALLTYQHAKATAKTVREAVTAGRMPPWHADPRYGKFTNDRSLPAAEKETLLAWIDQGMPLGDERELPAPREFLRGWSIGAPDVVITMPEEFVVPAEGVVDYQRFVIDPSFKEDRWVERAEAKPGCRAVHHILVYAFQPGKSLYDLTGNTRVICGTAPGDMPLILEPGQAKKIPAGYKLLFEVHYTPNGKVERDRSSVGLIFAKQPPKQEVRTNILVKHDIRIPAGEPSHREVKAFTFPHDIRIISLLPHMHLRGKSWEYRIEYPDGRSETILNVPRFDFGWQSVYRFADPPRLPKGAKLVCTAHWDNSKSNPANPDPAKEVRYGLQTWEEMMNGWMDYVVEIGPG